ncbi:MAG: T9SS type A sorting domain-containing protein, partial [Alphaproteobacteria bacterium]
GGTVVYNGPSGQLSQTRLLPNIVYYYEDICYDAANTYSPVVKATATTLVSNIINTDFTGASPNYFSGISTQAANITQVFGAGVLAEKYVADSGYAIGTNTDTDYVLTPIDTSASYRLGFAVSNGWYEDYKVAPTTGYSLNVTSISGTMHQTAAASTNTFGVIYGIGTATTPPDTFYNAISNIQNVDTGKGTAMSTLTVNFSSINAGVTLNNVVSNISGSQVLYVRLIYYRANGGFTLATLYNAGLTLGGLVTIDLPISIAKFNAAKINATTAAVNWSVASATNIKEFKVTKSTDGTTFKSIASVAFAGSKAYAFNDNNLGAGTSYYRLTSIAKDGAEQYSNVATVVNKVSGTSILSLAPNLVHGTAYLNISAAKADNLTTRVLDLTGRTVQQKAISIPEGNSQTSFNFSNLKAGSYILEVIAKDGISKTIRFEKQ